MTWLRRQVAIFDKRILTATVAVVAAVLLAGGVEDHRSCLRTLHTRQKFNSYVDAAAIARMQSVIVEANRNPAQARIDAHAASAFLATKSTIPSCGTIPAGT